MSDEKESFCFSVDQEEFMGDFATREDAVEAAITYLDEDGRLHPQDVGESVEIFTSRQVPATDLIKKKLKECWLVDVLLAPLIDYLYDEVGEAVDTVEVKDKSKFAQAVREVILAHVDLSRCFTLERMETHARVITAEDISDAT